jgi:hypothetical protein
MRLEKNPVWTFCSLALMALFALSNADAALLFQDRHTGANGEQVVYRFEANVQPAVAAIEQSKAVKAATTWATQYYGLRSMTVANAQERMMPTHFWLVALTSRNAGKAISTMRWCYQTVPWLSRKFLGKISPSALIRLMSPKTPSW